MADVFNQIVRAYAACFDKQCLSNEGTFVEREGEGQSLGFLPSNPLWRASFR